VGRAPQYFAEQNGAREAEVHVLALLDDENPRTADHSEAGQQAEPEERARDRPIPVWLRDHGILDAR
jgi:hypothetical protein